MFTSSINCVCLLFASEIVIYSGFIKAFYRKNDDDESVETESKQ